jgi:hypothetical protein
MSDEETKINSPLSFEERLFARLESYDSRLTALEERNAETLKSFRQMIGEFRDMRDNVNLYLASFDEKLTVLNDDLLKTREDQRTLERRIRKLEVEDRPQVVSQEKEF